MDDTMYITMDLDPEGLNQTRRITRRPRCRSARPMCRSPPRRLALDQSPLDTKTLLDDDLLVILKDSIMKRPKEVPRFDPNIEDYLQKVTA
uniref:Uncharacterized protein n=1 Tax=Arundo donax TaxID=35708 RepID=A0A0A8ZCU9_ARUDO